MRKVDLSIFRFDFDLTFAVLLMHPDGTLYHRYASRDHTSPTDRLSMKGLIEVIRRTLPEHRAYQRNPSPPPPLPRRTIEEIPSFARRDKKKRFDCVHCHMVADAEREWAQEQKKWRRAQIWRWPLPDRVGIQLDPDNPNRISKVSSASPASRARLRSGDRIVSASGRSILSEADLQAVLHETSGSRATIEMLITRNDKEKKIQLRLSPNWKVGTPLSFSWRPSKWNLSPKPGFGGRPLDDPQLKKLGLRPGTFAFRITYVVTWGENAYTGRNAEKAGIRRNDIFLSAAGKRDFTSLNHFHAWFRLTRKVGTRVPIVLLRGKKRITVQLPVIQ